MISDLNLEEKANELWRGFSPKNETEFWQAYVKYLAEAQKKQQMPTPPLSKTGNHPQVLEEITPVSAQGKALAKAYHATHHFYDKGTSLARLFKKWQPGVWGVILLSFAFTYLFNKPFLWVIAIMMFVTLLGGYIKDSNVIELHSYELTIKLLKTEKPEKHRFYLKDIDQVSVSFNPHYDRYTFNVKTHNREQSFPYKLSFKEHQRLYDTFRLYKVYVAKWNHPTD